MTGVEAVYQLVLFGFVPMLLMVATVWILWHVLEKIDPDEVGDVQRFLTFIVVVIPFVMLIYGGLTIVLYDKMVIISGGSQPALSEVIVAGAGIYIGLTVWLWWHWQNRVKERNEARRVAANIAKLPEPQS